MKFDLQQSRYHRRLRYLCLAIVSALALFSTTSASARPAGNSGEARFSPWPALMLGGGIRNCPNDVRSMRGRNSSFVCRCTASATSTGSVWGTDTYTDDSRVCRAALHRGVISSGGGNIRVTILPGRNSYRGSRRNGVNTGDWGRWDGSFSVAAYGGSGLGGGGIISRASCPSNATQYRGTGRTISCGCSSSAAGSGSVWGSGVYTDDSRICRAAVHAGVIGSGGGNVTFRMVGPRGSYQQSSANGVSTRSYGAWSGSFSFSGGSGGSFGGGSSSVAACPGNATAYRGSGRTIECACAGRSNYTGSVWGTDIYTDDSAICRAAAHAGQIGRTGGLVRFQMVGPRRSYRGTSRRGISTSDYGAWNGSYRFVN